VKLRGKEEKSFFKAFGFEILKSLKPLKAFFFESHLGGTSILITEISKKKLLNLKKKKKREKRRRKEKI